MEDCGRGAAVEQLTARGMEEYQSPQWGVRKNYNLMSTNQIFDLIQSYFYLY